jgi:rhamnogalacturonan endolyase
MKPLVASISLSVLCGVYFFGPNLDRSEASESVVNQPALMENIKRGTVAVRRNSTEVYVGWRLLGTDAAGHGIQSLPLGGGAEPVKLNADPLTTTTDYLDPAANATDANSYFVRPVIGGVEQAAAEPFTLPANAPVQQYLSVPIQRPAGGTVNTSREQLPGAVLYLRGLTTEASPTSTATACTRSF